MATFNSPTDVTAGSLAKSSDLNNLDAAAAAAFALLPTNAAINAGTVNYAVDTGTANTYLVVLPMTATSYGDGLSVVMKPLNSNTGASTVNVDSLGVKSIKTEANTTPAANDIIAGVPVELRYSTTTGFFHIVKNSAAAATSAAASAAAALVSENAASASASAASNSANSASSSASTATTQASNSSNSAAAALVSQNAAAVSAAAALVSQNAAAVSAAAALVSENNAETAETNAETAETNAETAETNAAASAAAALVSENNTASIYDSFDDRYLGAKASDPTLDNDGNALLTGALYWNTATSVMKVYNGAAWAAFGIASITAGNGISTSLLAGIMTISANLKANGGLVIESTALALDLGASSITGTLAVGDGGTGKTSVTANSYLKGNGTGALVERTYAEVRTDLGIADAMTYKGVIDCSASPNYPAADAGDYYKVSVAGLIGGGSGIVVEAGDALICNIDGSASGTQAAVGANWNRLQTNIDLANPGPIGATTPAAGSFTTIKMTTGAAVGIVVSDVSGNLVSDSTPALGTPSSGALDNCTSDTAADNDSSTQLATTAFAKSQDAVLHRDPDQAVALTAGAIAAIPVTHSTVFSNTTNSFGLGGKQALPSWTPAADQVIDNKWAANVGYKLVVVATSGIFRLTLNATVYDSTVPGGGAASNLVAGTAHSILAIPRVGATTTTVDFMLDGVLLNTTAAQANVDVTNTQVLYVGGTSAATYAMTIYDVYHLNLAPTVTEWRLAYLEGIPESWKWGSQTAISSDTMASDNRVNWATNGTLGFDTDHYTWIGSTDNRYLYISSPYPPCVQGKKYRLSCDVKDGTASGASLQFEIYDGVLQQDSTSFATTSSWVTHTTEFTVTANDATPHFGLNLITNLAGNNIQLKNWLTVEIGVTLALLPESWQSDKPYDASGNQLTVAYPASGWSLTRRLPFTGPVVNNTLPAFLAIATGQSDIATTSWVTVTFTERKDRAFNFDANEFTAPVTGLYQLNAIVQLNQVDSATTDLGIRLNTSNLIYALSANPSLVLSADSILWFSFSILADMDAGDKASITVYQGDGAQQMDVSPNTTFSGYFVC